MKEKTPKSSFATSQKRLPENTQESPTKTSNQLFTSQVYFSGDSRASKASVEEGEEKEIHKSTWTHVTCNGFTSLGSILWCGGLGALIVSLLPRTEKFGTLEREAIRQVGWRDLEASRHTRSFSFLAWARSLGLLSLLSGKRMDALEVKPACCLWLFLAGVPWPCHSRAPPQHPPRAHCLCSTSPPSIWLILREEKKNQRVRIHLATSLFLGKKNFFLKL